MNFQYIKHTRIIAMAALLAGAISGCTPESSDKELGPLPTASFTADILTSNPNRIVVANTTPGGFLFDWKDDSWNASKREKDTLAYFWAGEYILKFTVFTSGGYDTSAKKITIAKDVVTKDILKGGNMEAGSEQFWTVLNTGGTQTAIKFVNGKLNFSNTGSSSGAIYQEVNVIAGKFYRFSGLVSGEGASDSWFEVYFGTKAPEQGKDYTDNKFIALSTWAGCAKIPFKDKDLAIFGCDGAGVNRRGVMMFKTSGKIYLVIKAGSSNDKTLGTGGISIDDVEFQEEI